MSTPTLNLEWCQDLLAELVSQKADWNEPTIKANEPVEQNLVSNAAQLFPCSDCGTTMELRGIEVPGRLGPLICQVCPKCYPMKGEEY